MASADFYAAECEEVLKANAHSVVSAGVTTPGNPVVRGEKAAGQRGSSDSSFGSSPELLPAANRKTSPHNEAHARAKDAAAKAG
jgi:hypothetical protein